MKKTKKPKVATYITESDGKFTKDQQDEFDFDETIYSQECKSYQIRKDLLKENMHRAFSIFLGKYLVLMVGRLKSMSKWTKIRDAMSLLVFSKLLQFITY